LYTVIQGERILHRGPSLMKAIRVLADNQTADESCRLKSGRLYLGLRDWIMPTLYWRTRSGRPSRGGDIQLKIPEAMLAKCFPSFLEH